MLEKEIVPQLLFIPFKSLDSRTPIKNNYKNCE
jgi:hypothetical protein